MNSAGERMVDEMTGKEETRLIAYLRKKGWSDSEILALLEYVRV